MYARATIVEGPPENIDQGIAIVQGEVLPAARQLDGFQGMFGAVDRASGKVMTFTLWESEEAMRASEEAANRMRAGAMDALGTPQPTVERYEVFIAEMV